MGKNITHVGPNNGDGQTCKVANQIIVALNIQAVSEALVFAAEAGADPAKVRQALMGGFASSRILEVHGERMLNGTFNPGFRIRLHQKDLNLALSAAKELNLALPNTAIAQQMFDSCAAHGGATWTIPRWCWRSRAWATPPFGKRNSLDRTHRNESHAVAQGLNFRTRSAINSRDRLDSENIDAFRIEAGSGAECRRTAMSMRFTEIGQQLRAYRLESGLRAEEIAARLGVSRAALYRYEKGEVIKLDTIKRLAELLKISPLSLLGIGVEYYNRPIGYFERIRQVEETADQILQLSGSLCYLTTSDAYDTALAQAFEEAADDAGAERLAMRSMAEQVLGILASRKRMYSHAAAGHHRHGVAVGGAAAAGIRHCRRCADFRPACGGCVATWR